MSKLAILIFLIVFVIFYKQKQYINKLPYTKSYEIIQANNPDKDTYEELMMEKKPAVFTNVLEGLDLIKYDLNKPDFDKNFLKQELKEHYEFYLIPLNFNYNFNVNNDKKNTYTPIMKQTSYRYLITQITGIKKILLFSPEQKKYLYCKKNYVESKIDFWDESTHENYPLFKKGKYVEIIVKQNQMVYIPYKWWYTIYEVTDGISIVSESESLFSYFLKK
jgi:hypothetical protein